MFTYEFQGLSYSAIIIRVGLGIAERGGGDSSSLPDAQITTPWFTSQRGEHAQANALDISVNREVSVGGDGGRSGSGGGAGARSNDPEIALELIDDLSMDMHGAKLGRPWEAPPWHPRSPAQP
jgi:hypothetical protein